MFGLPKMMESDGTQGASPHCFQGLLKWVPPNHSIQNNLDYCIYIYTYIVYSTYGFGVPHFKKAPLNFIVLYFKKHHGDDAG